MPPLARRRPLIALVALLLLLLSGPLVTGSAPATAARPENG